MVSGTRLSAVVVAGNVINFQALVDARAPLDVNHSWYGPPILLLMQMGGIRRKKMKDLRQD